MDEPRRHDPQFERWPAHALATTEAPMPGWSLTIWRGVRGRCPRCGLAPIFNGYLEVFPECRHCAAPLGDMPADDAPPYIAMIAVLHVVVLFTVLAIHGSYMPGWRTAILLLVLLAGLCMIALRLAKGAVIGILLKLGLRREPLRG